MELASILQWFLGSYLVESLQYDIYDPRDDSTHLHWGEPQADELQAASVDRFAIEKADIFSSRKFGLHHLL